MFLECNSAGVDRRKCHQEPPPDEKRHSMHQMPQRFAYRVYPGQVRDKHQLYAPGETPPQKQPFVRFADKLNSLPRREIGFYPPACRKGRIINLCLHRAIFLCSRQFLACLFRGVHVEFSARRNRPSVSGISPAWYERHF